MMPIMMNRCVLGLLGILIGLTSAPALAAEAPASAPASAPTTNVAFKRTKDIVYGRSYGAALVMDVFRPTHNANRAAVVVIVSGGWVSSHDVIDSPFFGAFSQPFLNRGYTVFTVCHACQPKFQIPEIVDNINRAVRFIRFHAKDYGIDGDRIGVTGGSAGGHLSLMQGIAPRAAKADAADPIDRVSSKVQAVGCYFPPTDFLNWGKEGVNVLDTPSMAPFIPAMDFTELDPKTHRFEHITDKKRVEQMQKDISPAYFASIDDAPTLILHGDKDPLVPIQQAELMIENLKKANVPAELYVKVGASHGWPNILPDMERIADWFDRYLAKPAEKK
jgi:acetyl esterase/lipase